MEDLRSKSYNTSSSQTQIENPTVIEFKKVNNKSISRIWSLTDPEMQRKKRIASYKSYTVEGKVKGSIKKSFKWITDKYSKMVYGLRS